MQQRDNLTLNGHAPSLVFGLDFFKRTPADQIKYLKKLAASQNEALIGMQDERNDLRKKLNIANASLENAQSAFDAQKLIITGLVNKSNSEGQDIASRINELETRVKAQDNVIEAFNGDKH